MCWIARNRGKLLNRGAESKVDQCSGDKWDKQSADRSAIQSKGELTAAVGGPDPARLRVGKRAAERREAAPRAETW